MPNDERKRKTLTPMSGELRAEADWSPGAPVRDERKPRKVKQPPVTRRHVLFAGFARIVIVLVILTAVIAAVALLVVELSDAKASRVFPLAFLAGGGFLAVGGFLGASTGPSTDWMPVRGYDYEDRRQWLSSSVVYGFFGVVLVIVGVVLDAYL